MSSTACSPSASTSNARIGRWSSRLMLALVAWVGVGTFSPPAHAAGAEWELGLQPPPALVSDRGVSAQKPQPVRPKAGQVQVLQDAAGWLVLQQAPNGSFPWTVGGGSFANTQGATALGLVRAYAHTGDADHLAAAVANGDCFLAGNACIADFRYGHGGHRFASHDQLFLIELSSASGDPAYAALVQTDFWDGLASGTYGASENLDAAGYAGAVMASRTGGGIPELVAWDLSKTAIAAHLAGQSTAHAALMAQVLDSLNLASPTHDTYDVIGLAGGLWAGAATGTDLDPTSGPWASADSNAALAGLLLGYQAPSGGFVGSTALSVTDANASGQVTSFAIQALQAVDPVLYQSQIAAGFAYIVSLQQPDGQYLGATGASTTASGGVEVHGEILEAYAIVWVRPDRYVATTGSDAGNDCSIAANPCLTIQHAVDEADVGNTIHIASGTYIDPVLIAGTAKDGLVLLGEGPAKPVLTRLSGAANQRLLTIHGTRGVRVENLHFAIDQSYVAEGILANGLVDGLTIEGNDFIASHTVPAQTSTFGWRNAISINLVANSASLGRVDGSFVAIRGNTVQGLPSGASLRSGISMDAGVGLIDHNDIAAGTQDIAVRFAGALPTTPDKRVVISNNQLSGRGLQITSPNATSTGIEVLDNTITALAGIDDVTFYPADWNLVRLIHNAAGVPTRVAGNTFQGHRGHYRGVTVQNFHGVELDGNTFTPAAGAADFVSLVISNKELTTDAPILPAAFGVTATGNRFDGAGAGPRGRAVEFINDNDFDGGAAYGSLTFGGVGAENEFSAELRWTFFLNASHCDTRVPPGTPPQCAFLNYNGVGAGVQNTQVRPFAGLVSAEHNLFDGVAPADMDPAQRNALLARTQDVGFTSALGRVDYGFAATQPAVYVDDDAFTGAAYGDTFTFAHADPAADGQVVQFGVNAFSTIPEGLVNVQAGGTVYIGPGTYDGFTLNKHAALIGNDSDRDGAADGDDNTLIQGQVTVGASGVDADDPVALRNLEVSNTAGAAPANGFGIALTGSNRFIELSGLRVWGNVQHGLWVAAGGDVSDLVIRDSTFDRNGYTTYPATESLNVGAGFSTSQDAVEVSNVLIEDSDFLDNAFGGIVINNANSSASGSQVTGWEISGGNFLRNNQATTNDGTHIDTPFGAGGGLWIKTSGVGSLVDDIYVHGATFADNGSAREVAGRMLNRAGITLRSRPGATLGTVRICGNTFEETPNPGTQEVGVYVYDQAGSAGYTPVVICDEGGTPNTFIELDYSVSGYEQNAAGNGDAVVNVTSATPLTGWEHLSFPSAATVYVDDGFAGTTNGASVGFVGNTAPACAAATATFAVDAFATITEALAHVTSGGIVCVAPGVYAEDVTVSAPVTILGAQAGVDARDRSVGDANETIIVPATQAPGLDMSSYWGFVVSIPASGVAIDGIVIDTDNTALPPVVTTSYGTPDKPSGIFAQGSDIELRNLVFRNVLGSALWGGYSVSTVYSGNSLTRSRIGPVPVDGGFARAVVLFYNFYADITENLIEQARVGIYTENHYTPVGGGYVQQFADNEIHASRAGVWHNLFYNDASPTAIAGNRIFAVDAASETAHWAGVWIQSMGGSQELALSANAIDGGDAWTSARRRLGYALGNITSAAPVATRVIDGGTVENVDVGVLSSDAGTIYTGPVNDFLVRNVSFSDIGYSALYVEDTDQVVAGTGTARLTIGAGNDFGDSPRHLALSGTAPQVAGEQVEQVFVRSARSYLLGANGTGPCASGCTVASASINTGIAAASVGGVVTVEAGDFPQNVVVGKSVTVQGPFPATAGHHDDRDGTGEASIQPASGTALTFAAPDAVVRGLTIQGSVAGGTAIRVGNASADGIALTHSRIVNVSNGSGIESEIGANCAVDGVAIVANLFRDIGYVSTTHASQGRGIRLGNGHCNVQIVDNVFDTMLYAANLNGGNSDTLQGLTITDNEVRNTAGTAFVITATNGTLMERNTVTAAPGGLFISDKTSNFVASCNAFSAGNNAVSAGVFFGNTPNVNVRIFHNAISGGANDVRNALAEGLIVGSNWYDGAPPTASSTGGALLVADPLPGDPTNGGAFDVDECGDNAAVALVAVGGGGQSRPLNQPFVTPLTARLEDALSGAVMGETVTVAAPASGASALLTATLGGTLPGLVTNYNGIVETTAIANGYAGTYDVTATNDDAGAVAFTLTNTALPQVAFDLNGPVGGVRVGEETAYTGYIGNDDPDLTEPVFLRLRVSGGTPLVAGYVLLSVVNPVGPPWPPLLPLTWTEDSGSLVADFPGDAAGIPLTNFTIQPTPYEYLHNFRVVYGKAGVFVAHVDLIGATSGTVYASDVISTEVIAEHAGIALDITGPVAGVEKDVPTAYSATLANTAAEVADNVLVELVFTRDGGVAGGDLTVEYDAGGGVFDLLVLDASEPGELSATFGPPGGFTLTEGYDATTAFRVTYHRAPDTFRVAATVVDAVPDTDGVAIYAADSHATDVIEADPDVDLRLSGPFEASDGVTPVAARVAEPVIMRGELRNEGGNVQDPVRARFVVGASFTGIADDDIVASYGFVPIAADCGVATFAESVSFAVVGDTLTAQTVPQPLPQGTELAVCFRLEFRHAGVYSIGGTIVDADDANVAHAADNLQVTVGKGQATIALAGLGAFDYDGSAHPATVDETTPAGLEADVVITYNGGSAEPVAVGAYAVLATLDHPDYEAAPVAGLIVIGAQTGTVVFSPPLTGAYGGTHAVTATIAESGEACDVAGVPGPLAPVGGYTVFAACNGENHVASGSATYVVTPASASITVNDAIRQFTGMAQVVVATTSPPGLLHSVTYAGSGATLYPPTTVAPGAVGSYAVTATIADPNYTAAPDTATLVIVNDVVLTLGGDSVGVAHTDPATYSFFEADAYSPVAVEPVVVAMTLSRQGGILPGDVTMEFAFHPAIDPAETFQPFTLTPCGTDLCGVFDAGEPAGFDLPPASLPTTWRASSTRGGRYTVTAQIVGEASGTVYATAAHAVDVADLGLTGSGNAAGVVGEAVSTAATLGNAGAADLGAHMTGTPNDENVRGRFTITLPGEALIPADTSGPGGNCGSAACASPDVHVEFFNPLSGSYVPIYNLRQAGDGVSLYGHFGALSAGGVPVPAGYTGTFLFRTTFLSHPGTYTVTSQVVGVDTGKVYAQAASQSIGIDVGAAASIVVVSGDGGEAVVGGNVYDFGDLVVEVRDSGNNPVSGATVAFNVLPGANGAGAALSVPAATDGDGRTYVTATSNTVAGAFQVSATLSNGATLAHPFALSNNADTDPAQVRIAIESGSGQTAQVGSVYGLPLVAKVTDFHGNPLEGVDVAFSAPTTGAGVTPDSVDDTDADGLASSGALTANATAGAVAVTARLDGADCDAGSANAICEVAFALTNTAGGADSVTLVSSADDAVVGTAGAYALTATVADAGGNPVQGVSVTLIGPSAGAGVAPAVFSGITDADGRVAQAFNANTVAGVFQVQAVVSGVAPATVGLENLPGAAAKIVHVSGNGQSTVVNTAFADLAVRVLDAYDNPVADDAAVEVEFVSVDNGSNAAAATVSATANSGVGGLASTAAVANGTVGSYSVVAGFNGTNVSFALENTLGSATIEDIVWADNGLTSIQYDGDPKAATATVSGGHAVAFAYNGSSTAPTDAGDYLVTATVDDGVVHGTASAMLTIAPAAAGNTGIVLTGGSFVYDGTAKPATVDNPGGVAYTLAYDTGNGLPPVNVGNYVALLTVTDPNHASQFLTVPIDIVPATVTLGFGSLSHVYDSTAKAATVTTTPAGVTGVSLAYGPDAAPTNAGSYTVTATLSNSNYTLTGATTAELVIAQATAQIFLSNLTQVYDGSVKSAAVATAPASLAGDVSVVYVPANPVDVGSYAVTASLSGQQNYADVSVNATLTIVAATIAGFEIVGDDAFTGVAGEALAAPLPTVRVFDTSDNGVASIGVLFSVTAGDGSILGNGTATVTTDASGHATVPEWVLGAVAGGNTLTAQVSGIGGLPTLVFNATGTQEADVSIGKAVDLAQAHAGQVLTWTIVVENAGPSTAEVELADALPDGLESIAWTCVADGDAVCGEAGGNGDIQFTSAIPAGGGITVVVSATVGSDAAIGTMTNEASATWETGAATDSASTSIVHADTGPCAIFCDGFEDEPEGKALALPGEDVATTSGVRGWVVHPAGSGTPGAALELVDASGKAVAWLDTLKAGDAQLVRLRQRGADGFERAGAWSRWHAGQALGYGWDLSTDGLVLRFAPAGGGTAVVELHLPAGAPIPESARALRASVR